MTRCGAHSVTHAVICSSERGNDVQASTRASGSGPRPRVDLTRPGREPGIYRHIAVFPSNDAHFASSATDASSTTCSNVGNRSQRTPTGFPRAGHTCHSQTCPQHQRLPIRYRLCTRRPKTFARALPNSNSSQSSIRNTGALRSVIYFGAVCTYREEPLSERFH